MLDAPAGHQRQARPLHHLRHGTHADLCRRERRRGRRRRRRTHPKPDPGVARANGRGHGPTAGPHLAGGRHHRGKRQPPPRARRLCGRPHRHLACELFRGGDCGGTSAGGIVQPGLAASRTRIPPTRRRPPQEHRAAPPPNGPCPRTDRRPRQQSCRLTHVTASRACQRHRRGTGGLRRSIRDHRRAPV